MNLNSAEREVIGLCIAVEAINDIANHALLDISDVSAFPGEAEVHFKTHVHQQMFVARLLDFAKERGDAALTGVRGSCLDVLRSACRTRSFDVNGSVDGLEKASNALDDWLNTETELKLWLPTLNIEANFRVARSEFLFILGNHVKHNLSRLTRVSRRVSKILEEHGHRVQVEEIPLALDDFREHLQEGYFSYYGTWLAQLLNNVRWGVQDYLEATFRQSYIRIPGKEPLYEYRYPASITHKSACDWFWRLMNHVRSGPYIKRFQGAHYMKREVLWD